MTNLIDPSSTSMSGIRTLTNLSSTTSSDLVGLTVVTTDMYVPLCGGNVCLVFHFLRYKDYVFGGDVRFEH